MYTTLIIHIYYYYYSRILLLLFTYISLIIYVYSSYYLRILLLFTYTPLIISAVAQWLSCCDTNRKDAGSIPADVIGNFH